MVDRGQWTRDRDDSSKASDARGEKDGPQATVHGPITLPVTVS